MSADLAQLGDEALSLEDLQKARVMIRECLDASMVREIRDKAKAVQVYQRERGIAVQAQQDSAELAMWAERRLGEILAATVAKGRPKKVSAEDTFSLADLGITRKQSSRWQRAAAVDQDVADSYATMVRGTGSAASTSDLVELAKLSHVDGIAAVSRVMKGDARDLRSALRAHHHTRRLEGLADNAKDPGPLDELGTFSLVYIDPPWTYDEGTTTPDREIGNHYDQMSLDQIEALPVDELAADSCVLAMWIPSPMAYDSDAGAGVVVPLLEAWGFTFKAIKVWDKISIGNGYWWRVQHELLILAVRGDVPPPAPADRPPSMLTKKKGAHSAKPPEIRRELDRMFPGGRKIEVFARGSAPGGWTFWGGEASKEKGKHDEEDDDEASNEGGDEEEREEEDGFPGWPEDE